MLDRFNEQEARFTPKRILPDQSRNRSLLFLMTAARSKVIRKLHEDGLYTKEKSNFLSIKTLAESDDSFRLELNDSFLVIPKGLFKFYSTQGNSETPETYNIDMAVQILEDHLLSKFGPTEAVHLNREFSRKRKVHKLQLNVFATVPVFVLFAFQVFELMFDVNLNSFFEGYLISFTFSYLALCLYFRKISFLLFFIFSLIFSSAVGTFLLFLSLDVPALSIQFSVILLLLTIFHTTYNSIVFKDILNLSVSIGSLIILFLIIWRSDLKPIVLFFIAILAWAFSRLIASRIANPKSFLVASSLVLFASLVLIILSNFNNLMLILFHLFIFIFVINLIYLFRGNSFMQDISHESLALYYAILMLSILGLSI